MTYSQNTDRVDGELIDLGEAHSCGCLEGVQVGEGTTLVSLVYG